MNESPSWKLIFRNFSPAIIYKTLWVYYLVFHTFFSSSTFLPEANRWVVFTTGLLALAFHRWDKNQYFICFHKLLFISFNVYPLAIDNRVTVAIFESAVFILIMLRYRSYEALRIPYRIVLSLIFFFAAFHKLNSTHLIGSGSCSRFLGEGFLPLPSEILIIMPFIVVAGEFYLAYVFARTKGLPIISMLLFSIPLSVMGFHQFIAILWVLACPLSFADEVKVSSRWIVSLAILFSLNSLSPYLGLKNAGAMNMYSNLSLENGFTNHYIFPRAIAGNLGDTVRIIRTNYPYLQPETTIPRKFLQSILRYSVEHGYNNEFTIDDHGVKKEILTNKDRVEFSQGLSIFEYYLLSFSGNSKDLNRCLW